MARQFNGSSDYMAAAGTALSGLTGATELTVAIFARLSGVADSYGAMVFRSRPGGERGIGIEINDVDTEGVFSLVGSNDFAQINNPVDCSEDLLDQYVFIALTWASGEGPRCRVWDLDGNLIGDEQTGEIGTGALDGGDDDPLTIGANTQDVAYWAGRIANLYVTNEKLADADLDKLRTGTGGVPPTPSVDFWTLNSSGGTEVGAVNGVVLTATGTTAQADRTGVPDISFTAADTGAMTVAPVMAGVGYSVPPLYPNAPVFKAAGAADSGTGAATCAWPTHATNDVALLLIETEAQASTLSTSAGFVQVTNSPQSSGSAGNASAVALQVFWARATSASMPSAVLADPGDHVIGQILTFSNVVTFGNPWDITGGGTQGTGSTTGSITGVVTTVPNTLVVPIIANETDLSTSQAVAFTNSNLVGLAEITDVNTTSGDGGGFAAAAGVKLTAGDTGTTTATLANSTDYAFLTIALRGQPVHSGPLAMSIAPAMAGSGTVTDTSVTGTGAMAVAPSMSGTGLVGLIGAAAMTLAASMAGVGALTFTGTGAMDVAPQMSGAGLVGNVGTGTMTVTPTMEGAGQVTNIVGAGGQIVTVDMSGAGTTGNVGTGEMLVAPTMEGAGLAGYIGTGAMLVAPEMAGTGELSFSGAGAMLVAPIMESAGLAGLIGSGAMSVAPTMAGTAELVFTGSGAMSVLLEMAGTGTNTANNGITGSGEMLVAPVMAGTAELVFTGTGSLAVAPVMSGSGLVGVIGSGAMDAVLVMAGTGQLPVTGTGEMLVAPSMAGAGVVGAVGTGAMLVTPEMAGVATLSFSGSGASVVVLEMVGAGAVANVVGSGAMVVAPQMAGTGSVAFTGTGSLAVAPTFSGSGYQEHTGSGAQAVTLEMAGSGLVANPVSGTGAMVVPVVMDGDGEVEYDLALSVAITPRYTLDVAILPRYTVDVGQAARYRLAVAIAPRYQIAVSIEEA